MITWISKPSNPTSPDNQLYLEVNYLMSVVIKLDQKAVAPTNDALLTNRPFILGLFSVFNFLTLYLIFFENKHVILFSRYLDTLASLPHLHSLLGTPLSFLLPHKTIEHLHHSKISQQNLHVNDTNSHQV